MTKVVKSISLDERTAPLANEKSNFSRWVREQLLEEIQYTIPCVYFEIEIEGRKIWNETFEKWGKEPNKVIKEICNGQRKPPCKKCYPEGPPKQEDWLQYTRGRIDKTELLDRASKHWKWKTDQIKANADLAESKNQQNDPQRGGEKPKRAYVRRLLSFIWSFIW